MRGERGRSYRRKRERDEFVERNGENERRTKARGNIQHREGRKEREREGGEEQGQDREILIHMSVVRDYTNLNSKQTFSSANYRVKH